MLPKDILSTVLTYLAKPSEIGNCAQVCKYFKSAAESYIVWKNIAHIRYGEEVATSTIHMYENDWKAMVADDNYKGAFPTLNDIEPCPWRMNGLIMTRMETELPNERDARYYYCTIPCIKWDRKNKRVLVYIDARGEHDLRSPQMSSIRTRSLNGCMQCDVLGKFVSEIDAEHERPGHYKGYIVYPDYVFCPSNGMESMDGRCTFCYANRMQGDFADYEPVELFTFSPGFKIRDAFAKGNDHPEYSTSLSPYANETRSEEDRRWSFVESTVLKRKFPREWWV